jgi:MAF protein
MTAALILASSSKARQQLLAKLRLPFTVVVPDIDESVLEAETPVQHVLRLARLKAEKVAMSLAQGLVIGCDSVCVINGEILSKPETHANAVAQLRAQSGRTITFYTGLALINAKTHCCHQDLESIQVTFRELTDQQIEHYLAQDKPYECAGSIRAEGLGISLIASIHCHDPNSLVGLPLIKLLDLLQKEACTIL